LTKELKVPGNVLTGEEFCIFGRPQRMMKGFWVRLTLLQERTSEASVFEGWWLGIPGSIFPDAAPRGKRIVLTGRRSKPMKRLFVFGIAGLLVVGGVGVCGMKLKEDIDVKDAASRVEVFAPVRIGVNWEQLSGREKEALKWLYGAAKMMDEAFLVQVSPDNPALRAELEKKGDPDLLRFFRINYGPWDRLASDEPVLVNEPKPLGAGFYPPDLTREEFEEWLKNHPSDRESFESNFTVIERDGKDGLRAVPYSKAYREYLVKAAEYLRKAASLVENESLSKFLNLRADAFLSDDYYESDMAWMDVKDNVIDVTIGPYEVYEDRLFNYKAAFEAFICIRDAEESRKLEVLKDYLVKMEKNLPIEDRYKNLERGLHSPISVVEEVYSAGDTRAGVQTLAFNLPNDERVREAKGSKKVMLKNISEAKFNMILKPIAERVIAEDQLGYLTFDAYFNHTLLHEFSHGLGPGRIKLADGTETTVNRALKETYSAIEEAKADVVGQYNYYYLIDEGFFPEKAGRETAVTFLGGFFRSVRFGVEEAHGRANMIAFNYLKEKGVYSKDEKTGRWRVDFDRVRGAVRDLAHDILMIQALGDYGKAKEFIEKYGEMGEDVKESLERLKGIPVDIEPSFELEKEFGGDF